MNCFEFRQRRAADPNDRNIEFQHHVLECPTCAAYIHNQKPFEQHLRAALDVPVPENLASRILLHQSMAVEHTHRIQRRSWLALAASVLMAVGVSTGVWLMNRADSTMQLVLNHIEEEPQSLSEHQNVWLARVNETLKPFDAIATNALGRVGYLSICKIRKAAGVHLVVKDREGSVTVLIMPGEYVHDRVPIQDERFQGVIVPIPNGSMAIVAEHGKPFMDAESRVRANVRFSF